MAFHLSVRDTGAVQLICLYASTVTREGAGNHGWPAGMYFFAPAPRVFVCLSVLTEMYLLLCALESPECSVPDFLGPL